MSLDLGQLRTFLEAARAGSYTAAARRLHVTQSAVSHAIAKLEASAGRPLVEWRAKRMDLTPAGEDLKACCERVFSEIAAVEARIADPGRGLSRTVRIGAPVEFGVTVLLRKIKPLVEARPDLHLDFRMSHHLLRPLLRQEIDLAIDCVPHQHPSVLRTELFREIYVMIASGGFIEKNALRSPRDLSRVPVLSMDKEGTWWNRVLASLPANERPELSRIVEINHIRGIIHAASEGLGVGLVPKYTVLDDLREGALETLFASYPLLEDRFFVFQLSSRAEREENRAVTEYLLGLDTSQFADAIGSLKREGRAGAAKKEDSRRPREKSKRKSVAVKKR